MGVVHIRLVHRDPCRCKVKGFRAVSFIERNVSKVALARGTTLVSWRSTYPLFFSNFPLSPQISTTYTIGFNISLDYLNPGKPDSQ